MDAIQQTIWQKLRYTPANFIDVNMECIHKRWMSLSQNICPAYPSIGLPARTRGIGRLMQSRSSTVLDLIAMMTAAAQRTSRSNEQSWPTSRHDVVDGDWILYPTDKTHGH